MTTSGGYRFLYGADMAPEAIRRAFPGASFVARAWMGDPAQPVWGVLIAGVGPSDRLPVAEVTTDDGRRFLAAVPSPVDAAEPAAVIAAARYWELSPAYIERLVAAEAAAMGDADGA
ncbi:MAG TPA: hypothetical protein VFU81_14875 [Thermomicrobiales bacterium]|nr:hypothetical protein [Thermomicrobiales bacterium]